MSNFCLCNLQGIFYFYVLIQQFHPTFHNCTIVYKLINIYTELIIKHTNLSKSVTINDKMSSTLNYINETIEKIVLNR